jgi:general secretion pathway protein H
LLPGEARAPSPVNIQIKKWFSGPPGNSGTSVRARNRRAHKGFTLVEMLVVMVIIALVLGLVGSSLSKSVSGAEMRNAARKLAANLRYTRTRAILTKKETVLLIDTENGSYTAPDRPEVELPEGMEVELTTARSELTSEAVGGIRFYPDGGSTGGFVRLDANGRIYRVNVTWLTGAASVERQEL